MAAAVGGRRQPQASWRREAAQWGSNDGRRASSDAGWDGRRGGREEALQERVPEEGAGGASGVPLVSSFHLPTAVGGAKKGDKPRELAAPVQHSPMPLILSAFSSPSHK
jgi:hypothetical protein